MKLSIGSDHGGYALKKAIIEKLHDQYEWMDCGTYNENSCDYPDFAIAAAKKVASGECDFGIVICKSGIGMSIVANKVKGVRCALVFDKETAILTKQHNDANMLALSANHTDVNQAVEMIQAWLTTSFLGERHANRVQKIVRFENEQ